MNFLPLSKFDKAKISVSLFIFLLLKHVFLVLSFSVHSLRVAIHRAQSTPLAPNTVINAIPHLPTAQDLLQLVENILLPVNLMVAMTVASVQVTT